MKNVIASVVLGALVVGVPFLCGLSYGLQWDGHAKFFLTVCSLAVWFVSICVIYKEDM